MAVMVLLQQIKTTKALNYEPCNLAKDGAREEY